MTNELTSLFLTVAELSLSAVPVILVLFALRFLLRRAPKVYSYALWAAAGFRLLCPVALPSGWSLFNLPIFQNRDPKEAIALTERAVQAGTRAIRRTAGTGQAVVSGTSVSGMSAIPSASSAPAEVSAPGWSVSQIVTLLWLAGILCILLWNGYQLLRLCRRTRTAVRTEGNVWESDQIPVPFILGLFRPRIYLPAGLEGTARACVLAHERHHLRRHDPWVKALAFCIRTLHWFNPAVWLAVWAMEEDMELSCDEGALSRLEGDCRQDYSRTLLALGANRRDFGPVLAFGTPAVKQRILHVLSLKKAGRATIVLALAVLLTAGLTCCTSASTGGWIGPTADGYTYKMPGGTKSFAVCYEEQADGRTVSQGVIAFGSVGQVNGMLPSKGSFDIRLDTDGSYFWTENSGVVTHSTLSLETADLFAQADSTGGGGPAERVPLTLDEPTELFTMTAEQDGALTAQVTCYLYPSSQSEDDTYAQLTGADYAKQLYAARVQYVGDSSAVGALRNVVVANNVYQDCTMELFTGEEPYGLALHFTAPEGWTGSGEELAQAEQEALRNGILMLALIDNAEYYEQDLNGSDPFHMTVEDAEALLGIDDLKAYGQSETGVAELLERFGQLLDEEGHLFSLPEPETAETAAAN